MVVYFRQDGKLGRSKTGGSCQQEACGDRKSQTQNFYCEFEYLWL